MPHVYYPPSGDDYTYFQRLPLKERLRLNERTIQGDYPKWAKMMALRCSKSLLLEDVLRSEAKVQNNKYIIEKAKEMKSEKEHIEELEKEIAQLEANIVLNQYTLDAIQEKLDELKNENDNE